MDPLGLLTDEQTGRLDVDSAVDVIDKATGGELSHRNPVWKSIASQWLSFAAGKNGGLKVEHLRHVRNALLSPQGGQLLQGDNLKNTLAGTAKVRSGLLGVWLIHNHPNGVAEPSGADRNFMMSVREGLSKKGLSHKLKGDLIVGENRYASVMGNLGGRTAPLLPGAFEAMLSKNARFGKPLETADEVASFVKGIRFRDDEVLLIGNVFGRSTGAARVPKWIFEKAEENPMAAIAALHEFALQTGSKSVDIVVGKGAANTARSAGLRQAMNLGIRTGAIRNVLTSEGQVLAGAGTKFQDNNAGGFSHGRRIKSYGPNARY